MPVTVRLRRLSLLAVLASVAASAAAQPAAPTSTRTHVERLASPAMEGRLAGSPGEQQAAQYLVEQLTRLGARPLPGQSSMLSPFTFTAGSRDGGSTITVTRDGQAPAAFRAATEVQALSFSDSAEVSGPAVFAGYGIVVPSSATFGYDSYQGLDVKDRIVVVLRYFPEDADATTRAALARYSDLRYKAQAARQRGAKALVVITGPRSPNAGAVVPMSFDTALAGSGLVAASAGGAVADAIFAAVDGKTLASVQQEFDAGNPHTAGFAIPGVTLSVSARVVREQQTGRNVVAYLPATPSAAAVRPWVVIGAHYDHLGRGSAGNSLASADQAGQIHHGADDNASGTAAVLAIADALARVPRKRHLVVAFWSGEELGLIGSTAFVNAPPVPIAEMAAYLNFDMVGRSTDNKLTVQATGTSPAWPRLLEQANVAAGFDLVLQEDPYQPTDVSSFNGVGVASLAFFTGAHTDYHKPSDTAEKINYEDLDRIAGFAGSITRRLLDADEPPLFTKVEQKTETGGRAGLRIFTGTIPDYATDVKGLLLGGVIGGGPAEQAGLQKGDIIVELAGQSIANIYDYTYALDLLKIGQPATVVYMRGTARRTTTLTPSARK